MPESLPDPRVMLKVTRPSDMRPWIAMDVMHNWKDEPLRLPRDISVQERSLYYWFRAYVVRQEHLEEVFAWAQNQAFFGRWMPEVSEQTPQLMLRERNWSPAWTHFDTPYFGRPGWSKIEQDRPPQPVLPTWDYYLAEDETEDCSIDEGFTLHLPDPNLVNWLGLAHTADGTFVDRHGMLAAMDPTVREIGPGALLLREDMLDQLRPHGLTLLWTMFGEQRVFRSKAGMPLDLLARAELSGAFVLKNGEWEGTLSSRPSRMDEEGAKEYFRVLYRPRQPSRVLRVETG